MKMNSLERLLDKFEQDREELAESGYTVSLFVKHNSENRFVGFGDPVKRLEGTITSLLRVKECCLKAGLSAQDYKQMYDAAFSSVLLREAMDKKEKNENE